MSGELIPNLDRTGYQIEYFTGSLTVRAFIADYVRTHCAPQNTLGDRIFMSHAMIQDLGHKIGKVVNMNVRWNNHTMDIGNPMLPTLVIDQELVRVEHPPRKLRFFLSICSIFLFYHFLFFRSSKHQARGCTRAHGSNTIHVGITV